MPRPATVVFVDALAASYLQSFSDVLSAVQSLPSRAEIEPGLGFSINIKAELLGGLTPDDLGFFCRWNYAERPSFVLPRWLRALGSVFDGSQTGSRIAHRLLSRAVGTDLFTIPFDEISLFEPVRIPEASHVSFPYPTVLSRGDFRRITHGRQFRSDAAVAREALEVVGTARGENTYVAFIEADAVGHRTGPESAALRAKLREIDTWIGRLWDAHRRAGRGTFLVFSDHGMAPVGHRPWLDPREYFGVPGPNRYAWFSDSTMLRFWIFDPSLDMPVRETLQATYWGRILSEDERRRFGIVSRRHGDIVFLVDEGTIPTPSYVGGKRPRALGMHGYDPDLPSQAGLVAWWTPEGSTLTAPRRIRARALPDLWRRLQERQT